MTTSDANASAFPKTYSRPGPQPRVLDLGCGKGEFLIRLAERADIEGAGVDTNACFIDEALRAAALRAPGRLAFHVEDAATHLASGCSAEIVALLGASHALGGTVAATEVLSKALSPGGLLVLGDAIWRRTPTAAEAAAMGVGPEELATLPDLEALLAAKGFERLHGATTTLEDADRYEAAHHANIVHYAADHPHDAQAVQVLARRQRWQACYGSTARGLIGFAVLVVRRT